MATKRKTTAARLNMYNIPEAAEVNWGPYVLPVKRGKGLIIPDLHMPYHEPERVQQMLKHGVDTGATDFLIFLGDVLDCYQLSKFEKDPRAIDFADEVNMGRQLLSEVSGRPWKVIFKLGNHEARLEHYLFRRCPELFGCDMFSWEEQLKTKEYGVDIVPHDVVIYAGKLNIIHGHETAQGFGGVRVDPSRAQFLRTLECTLSAHHHRIGSYTAVTVREKPITSWSIGCGCQLHPAYSRLNNWQHGFATLDVDGDDFHVETFAILPKGNIVHA